MGGHVIPANASHGARRQQTWLSVNVKDTGPRQECVTPLPFWFCVRHFLIKDMIMRSAILRTSWLPRKSYKTKVKGRDLSIPLHLLIFKAYHSLSQRIFAGIQFLADSFPAFLRSIIVHTAQLLLRRLPHSAQDR